MNELMTRKDGLPLGTAQWQSADIGLEPYSGGDFRLGSSESGVCKGARDDRHVLIVAQPRSGKGTALLVPNMCLWPGSVVVIDPKGENAKVTARRRGKGSAYCKGMGQKVYLLDPMREVRNGPDDFDDIRASYNPLDLVREGKREAIEIAKCVAESISVWNGKGEQFWTEISRNLLSSTALHVATSKDFWEGERNLITVARLLMQGDMEAYRLAVDAGDEDIPSPLGFLFKSMQRNHAFGGVIAAAGAAFADMERNAAKTFIGVIAHTRTNIDFLMSPGMAECLSTSSFQLSDLKTDPKGISVFLTLPQRYMETHFRWLRMMTSLIMEEMERRALVKLVN